MNFNSQNLVNIIKSEVWTITNYLGLGHDTMICAVCLSIFVLRQCGLKHWKCILCVCLILHTYHFVVYCSFHMSNVSLGLCSLLFHAISNKVLSYRLSLFEWLVFPFHVAICVSPCRQVKSCWHQGSWEDIKLLWHVIGLIKTNWHIVGLIEININIW